MTRRCFARCVSIWVCQLMGEIEVDCLFHSLWRERECVLIYCVVLVFTSFYGKRRPAPVDVREWCVCVCVCVYVCSWGVRVGCAHVPRHVVCPGLCMCCRATAECASLLGSEYAHVQHMCHRHCTYCYGERDEYHSLFSSNDVLLRELTTPPLVFVLFSSCVAYICAVKNFSFVCCSMS